jgi:signal transduction histidine kinase
VPGESIQSIAIVSGVLSLGYVVLGAAIARRYDGIGVGSLSLFAVVWGAHFLLSSTGVFLLAQEGATAFADFGVVSVPRTTELFFLTTTPLFGLLTVVAIFGWLWFVLTYTTPMDRRDEFTIVAIAVVVFLFAFGNGLVGVASYYGYLDISPGLENEIHRVGAIIEILATGTGIGIGVALLYRSTLGNRPLRRSSVGALTAAVVFPYLVKYASQLGYIVPFRQIETLRATSLAIGLIGLWAAVERYRIFDQLPASQRVGRETAFEDSETPILVLDNHLNVSDFNAAAESILEAPTDAIIGHSPSDLLPTNVNIDALLSPGRHIIDFEGRDLIVEATTTSTTGDHGREIGRTIVFSDITEERRRQQRIQVLNRILRHNLRNDLNVARGYVQMLASDVDGEGDRASIVIDELDGLLAIAEKARQIEEVVEVEPTRSEPINLSTIVEEAIDAVEHDGASAVETSIRADIAVTVSPTVLRFVVTELVDNALRHNDDPTVTVQWDDREGALVVTDSGSGISDHEIEVFERGHETALQHGSGLGLWLVKWGVDRFGGSVRFDVDDSGSRVTFSIPPELVVPTDTDGSDGDTGV